MVMEIVVVFATIVYGSKVTPFRGVILWYNRTIAWGINKLQILFMLLVPGTTPISQWLGDYKRRGSNPQRRTVELVSLSTVEQGTNALCNHSKAKPTCCSIEALAKERGYTFG